MEMGCVDGADQRAWVNWVAEATGRIWVNSGACSCAPSDGLAGSGDPEGAERRNVGTTAVPKAPRRYSR
jgi:hypothetical protein